MSSTSALDGKINRLKRMLESTAARYQFNLHHPRVLKISQKLDGLIVEQMKDKAV